MVIFPLEGCNLQVAGCRSEFGKKKMSRTVYRSSQALKTEHYNDVLVISYSSQGHAKPEISDLSSINWFFSPRSFKARRKVLKLSDQLISLLLAKRAYIVTEKTGSSSLSLSAVPTIEMEITLPRWPNLYVHSTTIRDKSSWHTCWKGVLLTNI